MTCRVTYMGHNTSAGSWIESSNKLRYGLGKKDRILAVGMYVGQAKEALLSRIDLLK